jgi:CubicO group peptidase (beta-lactamase class C family)
MSTRTSWPFSARSNLTICLRIVLISLMILLCLGSKPADTVQAMSWPTSTPEAQGIDSNDLIGLLDWIQTDQLDIHSILIMRHNNLVMEVNYPPFDRDDKQMQQSITKSVTSALVGIAIGEGKIKSASDPFLNYFQGVPVQNMGASKQKITIFDLLNMTSGLEMFDYKTMGGVPDAVQVCLDKPMHFEPDAQFEYNPCNSVLLAAILQKTTGMTEFDYGMEKLFKPLGIKDVYWEAYSDGVTQGNTGLMLKPRDMLKFGMLYNQKGVWNGKQVVPADWIAATLVMNDNGYGYHWWQGFDGIGAAGYAGQIIFIFPKQDIVIVITAAIPDADSWKTTQMAINALFAIKSDQALPESPSSSVLSERIRAIEHPQAQAVPALPIMAREISGETIRLDANPLGWQTAQLEFKDSHAYLDIITKGNPKAQKYAIGLDGLYRGTPQKAVTRLAVPLPVQRYNLNNPHEFNFILGIPLDGKIWMKGAWTGEDVFTLTVQDSRDFDLDILTFHFSPPGARIEWYSATEFATQMTFQGKMK